MVDLKELCMTAPQGAEVTIVYDKNTDYRETLIHSISRELVHDKIMEVVKISVDSDGNVLERTMRKI